jgi:hypothetical protein
MFKINLAEPTTFLKRDLNDSTLFEAIETVFPNMNDYFQIIWNGVEIDMSYKYDLDVIIIDMIDILFDMNSKDSGSFKLDWPSSSFDSTWILKWESSRLEIESIWRSASGNINELNKRNILKTDLDSFKLELMKPLTLVYDTLIKAGYTRDSLRYFVKLEVLTQTFNPRPS